MNRPDPISWEPETMTKAEHRAEALHLMGRARRPQRPGEIPLSKEGLTHFILCAQLHLALSTDPHTPDERERPTAYGPVKYIITGREHLLSTISTNPGILWTTARGWTFRRDADHHAWVVTTDTADESFASTQGLATRLTADHYPITGQPWPAEDVVDAHVDEAEETGEYLAGWRDCWTMRTLHDRIPGFAIVPPRKTDPFDFNRDALAEYGITTPQQMYAVAHAPHGSLQAHPVKLPQNTEWNPEGYECDRCEGGTFPGHDCPQDPED